MEPNSGMELSNPSSTSSSRSGRRSQELPSAIMVTGRRESGWTTQIPLVSSIVQVDTAEERAILMRTDERIQEESIFNRLDG